MRVAERLTATLRPPAETSAAPNVVAPPLHGASAVRHPEARHCPGPTLRERGPGTIDRPGRVVRAGPEPVEVQRVAVWSVRLLWFCQRTCPPGLIVTVWGENENVFPGPTAMVAESAAAAATTIVPVMPPDPCGVQA